MNVDVTYLTGVKCCSTGEDLFSAFLDILRQSKDIPRTSKLFKMDPVVDQLGLLRVGGRLQRSGKRFHRETSYYSGLSSVGGENGSSLPRKERPQWS